MKKQVEYYKKRAEEYDLVYQKPERQTDLKLVKAYLRKQFKGQSIIEIACGTGYWTEVLSKQAKYIWASDINQEVIDIAKAKNYLGAKVDFELKDLKDLKKISNDFEGLFGGFIWSHIRREELNEFIKMALNQVRAGAEMVFIDNKFVSGSNTPINRKDKEGNTFQLRTLQSGEQFEILKNFPTNNEVKEITQQLNIQFEWIDFQYFWIVKFKKKM